MNIAAKAAAEAEHVLMAEERSFFRNISWTGLTLMMRVAFAGGALALLGRLVDPGTMGLYGMGWSAALLGFTISQSGAAQGIIALPKLDKEHLAAAQILSAALSLGIAAVIVALAPAVQGFYHYPHLAAAFVTAGLFVPLMSLPAVDIARAQRDLQFSRLARVQTGGVILAAVASLLLAWSGKGLVALFALQGLVGPFTFLLFRLQGQSTGFGRTTWKHVSDVWRIGMHLSLGSLTSVVWLNVPQLVLGKLVSVESLGLFVFCFRVIQLVFTQLSNMVNTVVYPTFSRFRHEPAKVGRSFLQTVRFTYFCLMLPLLGLAAAPGAFLTVYGGAKWAAADGILFYLVLMQMAISLGANVFPTFMALGRPQVAWQWNLFITAVQTGSIVLTAHWGMLAIVKGLALSAWIMPLAVYWLSRAAQFRFVEYMRNMAVLVGLLPPAIALGATIERVLGQEDATLTVAASATSAIVVYAGVILAIDSQAKQMFTAGARALRNRLAAVAVKV